MGWMLVVSEDETFQREAIANVREGQPIVGATGEASAFGLVRAVDVSSILVDALDDVGRRFLTILRMLPTGSLPNVTVMVVGDRDVPGFNAEPDISSALAGTRRAA